MVVTQRPFPETIDLLSPHAEVIVGPPQRDADALMVFMPDSLDDRVPAIVPESKNRRRRAEGLRQFRC